MSHGDPDKIDCSAALQRLYEYLDNEMPDNDYEALKRHLDECSPCLAEYGLDQAIKALVHRSCGCEHTPADLRAKVLARIHQAQSEVTHDREGLATAD